MLGVYCQSSAGYCLTASTLRPGFGSAPPAVAGPPGSDKAFNSERFRESKANYDRNDPLRTNNIAGEGEVANGT